MTSTRNKQVAGGSVHQIQKHPRSDAYSHFVRLTKVTLFVGGVALGGGLFLVAKSNITASQDAQERLKWLLDNPLSSGARSVGITEQGAQYLMTADHVVRSVEPNSPSGYFLEKVSYELRAQSGKVSTVSSNNAYVNEDTGQLNLSENVRGLHDEKYSLETASMDMNVDKGSAQLPGTVHVAGPNFTLTSGRLDIANFGNPLERYYFSGGVKVIYANSVPVD